MFLVKFTNPDFKQLFTSVAEPESNKIISNKSYSFPLQYQLLGRVYKRRYSITFLVMKHTVYGTCIFSPRDTKMALQFSLNKCKVYSIANRVLSLFSLTRVYFGGELFQSINSNYLKSILAYSF